MADDTSTDTAPPLTVHKSFNNTAPAASPQQGGRNYLRVCKLIIGNTSGAAIDLSGLRVRFQIISGVIQTPNACCVIISNVGRELFNKIQAEFTTITLMCGYEGTGAGIVFQGSITEVQYGEKENWTDPLLRLWAMDGDSAYNQARVSTTLAAVYTPQDIVDVCLKAFAKYGITMGQVSGVDLSTPVFPRGNPMAGMARDYMREVSMSKQATWNLNDGKLNIVHKDGPGVGSDVVLNSNTGLVGQVIEKTSGISVRCLINSSIKVNGYVQIDQKSIIQLAVKDVNADTHGDAANLTQQLKTLGVTDGKYRVLHIEINADTRGNEWYMDLTCIGATGLLNSTQIGLGFS